MEVERYDRVFLVNTFLPIGSYRQCARPTRPPL